MKESQGMSVKSAYNFMNIKVLRAFSCIIVMVVHLGQRMELQGTVRIFTDFGANGVYFFFCISGFLGYLSYEKCCNACIFWKKKLIRILPLVYIVLIYGFIYHFIILGELPPDSMHLYWLRYFFLLNSFIPAEGYWLNLYALWTIFVFVFFYLIMPLLFKSINSYGKAWMFTFILIMWNVLWRGAGERPFWTIGYLYAFSLGIVIYFALKGKKMGNFFLIAGILWILCEVMKYDIVMYTVVFSFIFAGSFSLNITSKVWNKVISVLDKYSYTLYLCHAIIMEWIDQYNSPGTGDNYIIIIVFCISVPILTYVIFNCLENPIQKYLKRILFS